MWAASGEVFAVGQGGTIVHHASPWKVIKQYGGSVNLRAIWAHDGKNVHVAARDRVMQYDGKNWTVTNIGAGSYGWNALWGSGAYDVFAVGDKGSNADIAHYTGTWKLQTAPPVDTLRGVWGSGPSDVYGVGDYFKLAHYDGAKWSALTPGTVKGKWQAVWGSGVSDIYVVGSGGAIMHFDGKAWAKQTSGATGNLYDVWGSSAKDVYAVGSSGTLLRNTGSGWKPVGFKSSASLRAIWGSGKGNIVVVGGNTYLTYNGSVWKETDTVGHYLTDVWGAGKSDIFGITSNAVLRYCP